MSRHVSACSQPLAAALLIGAAIAFIAASQLPWLSSKTTAPMPPSGSFTSREYTDAEVVYLGAGSHSTITYTTHLLSLATDTVLFNKDVTSGIAGAFDASMLLITAAVLELGAAVLVVSLGFEACAACFWLALAALILGAAGTVVAGTGAQALADSLVATFKKEYHLSGNTTTATDAPVALIAALFGVALTLLLVYVLYRWLCAVLPSGRLAPSLFWCTGGGSGGAISCSSFHSAAEVLGASRKFAGPLGALASLVVAICALSAALMPWASSSISLNMTSGSSILIINGADSMSLLKGHTAISSSINGIEQGSNVDEDVDAVPGAAAAFGLLIVAAVAGLVGALLLGGIGARALTAATWVAAAALVFASAGLGVARKSTGPSADEMQKNADLIKQLGAFVGARVAASTSRPAVAPAVVAVTVAALLVAALLCGLVVRFALREKAEAASTFAAAVAVAAAASAAATAVSTRAPDERIAVVVALKNPLGAGRSCGSSEAAVGDPQQQL